MDHRHEPIGVNTPDRSSSRNSLAAYLDHCMMGRLRLLEAMDIYYEASGTKGRFGLPKRYGLLWRQWLSQASTVNALSV